MSEDRIIARFESLLGKRRAITSADDVEPYSHDESIMKPFMPVCVLYPKTAGEVGGIVAIAGEESFPLTPRGGGTGLSGGAIPLRGGAVVSFEKMDRIVDIDEADNMAVVEPGVINGVLQREAEGRGLFYPVNPASMDSCTIGGNVATSAGGANAVRYGTTRNYVCGLSAVLADSSRLSLGGRVYKNVTDDKMIHAFIGSEGILALISEVTLKLLPRPVLTVDLVGSFQDFESVSVAARAILSSGRPPAMVELIDHKAMAITEKYLDKPLPFPNAPVSMMVRVDGFDGDVVSSEYERIGEIMLESGADDVLVAEEESERKRIWEARSSVHDALAHVAGIVSNEDVVVPRSAISALLAGLRSICGRLDVPYTAFGHLGDGNIHVNFLKEGRDDEVIRAAVRRAVGELFALVVSLGGKISGEHGIGLTKRDYLARSVDPAYIEFIKGLKKMLDPKNILNPGKVIT